MLWYRYQKLSFGELMIYSILAILLSLTIQQGLGQGGAETLLSRRVSVDLNKATVYDIVMALRTQHAIPLSFIQSARSFNMKEEISIKVSNGTIRDVLQRIKPDAPEYRYGFIEGHLVLYPNEPKYQRAVGSISIREIGRLKAAYSYLDALRTRWPEFKELLTPIMKGDPKAALYAERVSIKPRGTVLKGFAQLLGSNQSAVFSIKYREKAGRPAFSFDIVK
jgi:hypothetical protein